MDLALRPTTASPPTELVSLTQLAAYVVALNLHRYHPPDALQPPSLEPTTARWVVHSLDHPLELANWIWFAQAFGTSVIKPSHRSTQVPYAHLIHPLLASPSFSPLLQLNRMPSSDLIVSLSLSDTDFGDDQALALKELRFLNVLETERVRLTDAGVHQLASALHRGEEMPKGLYQLRAWSLRGCRGITDRSIKSLLAFRHLNFLDLRQTSCVFPTYFKLLKTHPARPPSSTQWELAVPPSPTSSMVESILLSQPERITQSTTGPLSLHIQAHAYPPPRLLAPNENWVVVRMEPVSSTDPPPPPPPPVIPIGKAKQGEKRAGGGEERAVVRKRAKGQVGWEDILQSVRPSGETSEPVVAPLVLRGLDPFVASRPKPPTKPAELSKGLFGRDRWK